MFERFTQRARKVMALANQESERLDQDFIGPEHILLGIIKEGSGVAAHALTEHGATRERIAQEASRLITPGQKSGGHDRRSFTQTAKTVVEHAIQEARKMDHVYVGTEHLLLGLLSVPQTLAGEILKAAGVDLGKARETVLMLLGLRPPAGWDEWPHAEQEREELEEILRTWPKLPADARRQIMQIVRQAGKSPDDRPGGDV